MNSMAKNLFRAIFYKICTDRHGRLGGLFGGKVIWKKWHITLSWNVLAKACLTTVAVVTKSSVSFTFIHASLLKRLWLFFFSTNPSFMCMNLQNLYRSYMCTQFFNKALIYENRSEPLPRMCIEYQFETHLFFQQTSHHKRQNGGGESNEKKECIMWKTVEYLVTHLFIFFILRVHLPMLLNARLTGYCFFLHIDRTQTKMFIYSLNSNGTLKILSQISNHQNVIVCVICFQKFRAKEQQQNRRRRKRKQSNKIETL